MLFKKFEDLPDIFEILTNKNVYLDQNCLFSYLATSVNTQSAKESAILFIVDANPLTEAYSATEVAAKLIEI